MVDFPLKDGRVMPSLGLGTWQLNGKKCVEAVQSALAMGYTAVDTAEIYENEAEVGRAIENKEVFVTSKVFYNHLRREDIFGACIGTLSRLGLRGRGLDLYLVHWPNKTVPMEETFGALSELVDKGLVRGIGVSNFTVKHLEQAVKVSKAPILVNQVEFHPFLYQKELLEYCKKRTILLTAYSPLARGKVFSDRTIKEIAQKHKKTPGQVTLRWLHEKGVVVIPKSSSEGHLQENLDIFNFTLDREDSAKLDNLPQQRLINPPFAEF